jgi:hypothetical protein
VSARFRFAALVVRPSITWFGDLAQPDNPTHGVTPPWAFDPSAAGQLVDLAGAWFKPRGEGVVLLQSPIHVGMLPAERRACGVTMINSIKAAGWDTSSQGIETGWFLCLRDGVAVLLGVGPWIAQDRTSLFSLDKAEPAPVIASHLATYHKLVGVAWRGTAGLSGIALLRGLRERNVPRWRWDAAPTDITGSGFELGRTQGRPATEAERAKAFVYRYDVRSMYLAAAAAVELSPDPLEHRGAQAFDPARPGYWRVEGTDDKRLFRTPGQLCWVTTEVMNYLAGRGIFPEVHDSLTGDRQSRIMRRWAEALRDARTQAQGEVEDAVKDTYARTVGMLRRPGGRIYRPDWRDAVVDLAKVNLLRKCDAAGVTPLKYATDSIWVATEPVMPDSIFRDQGNMGALRFENAIPMNVYLSEVEK